VLCYCAQGYVAKYQQVPRPTGAPQDNLPRSGSGVAGVADLRIQAAYDALLASKARKPLEKPKAPKPSVQPLKPNHSPKNSVTPRTTRI
jgi:hypothetical protein